MYLVVRHTASKYGLRFAKLRLGVVKGLETWKSLHSAKATLIHAAAGSVGLRLLTRPQCRGVFSVYLEDVSVTVRLNEVIPSTHQPTNQSEDKKLIQRLSNSIILALNVVMNSFVHLLLSVVSLDVSNLVVVLQAPHLMQNDDLLHIHIPSMSLLSLSQGCSMSSLPSLLAAASLDVSSSRMVAEYAFVVSPLRIQASDGTNLLEFEQQSALVVSLFCSLTETYYGLSLSLDHSTFHLDAILPFIVQLSSMKLNSPSSTNIPSAAFLDFYNANRLDLIKLVKTALFVTPLLRLSVTNTAFVYAMQDAVSKKTHMAIVTVEQLILNATASFKSTQDDSKIVSELSFSVSGLSFETFCSSDKNTPVFNNISMDSLSLDVELGYLLDAMRFDASLSVQCLTPTVLVDHSFVGVLMHIKNLLQSQQPIPPSTSSPSKLSPDEAISLLSHFISQVHLDLRIHIGDLILGLCLPSNGDAELTESSEATRIVSVGFQALDLLTQAVVKVPSLGQSTINDVLINVTSIQLQTLDLNIRTMVPNTTKIKLSSASNTVETLFVAPKCVLDGSFRKSTRSDIQVLASIDVVSLSVDLSWLTRSKNIDYFALAVTVQSFIAMQISNLNAQPPSHTASTPSKPPKLNPFQAFQQFNISWTVSVQVHQVLAGLVGEVSPSGLYAKISDLSVSHNGVKTINQMSLDALASLCAKVDSVTLASFNQFSTFSDLNLGITPIETILRLNRIDVGRPTEFTETSASLMCHITDVFMCGSFPKAFIGVHASLTLIKIIKFVSSSKRKSVSHRKQLQGNEQEVDLFASSTEIAYICIESLLVRADLPEDASLQGVMTDIKCVVHPNKKITGDILSVTGTALVDKQSETWNSILDISKLDFVFMGPTENVSPLILVMHCGLVDMFVPHGYAMSDIVENGVNLNRALKILLSDCIGVQFFTPSYNGKTVPELWRIPDITCHFDECNIRMEDDPFLARLSRIYRVGTVENDARISREKAFWKHAKQRESSQTSNQSEGISKAWNMLQEFNSKTYIEAIKRSGDTYPPLVHVRFTFVTGRAGPPTLPCETIEETLHQLDNQTPLRQIYDDLLAFDIAVEFKSAKFQLRDFTHPLLHVHEGTEDKTWITNGILIVADTIPLFESRRTVSIPLDDIGVRPFTLTRSVNLPKFYLKTETKIVSLHPLLVSYGACIEPALADMGAVIDSFSKQNVDPSPLIGWWDKLRLILHGQNSVHLKDSGEIRLRVLGSTSPYFDPVHHFGIEGMDIVFAKDVRMNIGYPHLNNMIVLEAMEIRISLPRDNSSGTDFVGRQDDLVTKVIGGIRLGIDVQFKTLSKPGSDVQVAPWKTHAEIVMRTPENCHTSKFNEQWDSFRGFRSHSMHICLDIVSPKPSQVHSGSNNNVFLLNQSSLNQIEILSMIYQSVLTRLQIQTRQSMANTALAQLTCEKPKLGRVMNSVRIKASLKPLLISLIGEKTDFSGGIGLRARSALVELDVLVRQHKLRQYSGEMKSIDRKPAYRWDLEESSIGFYAIEGCTLDYRCTTDTSTETNRPRPKQKPSDDSGINRTFLKEWTFPEDVYYTTDVDSFLFTPFLWSPRLVYFRNSSTMSSEQHHNIIIYKEQISLLKVRLKELEQLISTAKDEQLNLESRIAIYFNVSNEDESQRYIDKITTLYENKAIIETAIKEYESLIGFLNSQKNFGGKHDNIGVEFNQNYIVHNLRVLWCIPVRNSVFKVIEILTMNFSTKYCLSNAASKVVSELLKIEGERRKADETNRLKRKSIRPDLSASPSHSPGMANDFQYDGGVLLEKLLYDAALGIRTNVPNETEMQNERTGKTPGLITTKDGIQTGSSRRYISSNDPESPDYVSYGQRVEPDFVVTLINSQICLDPASDTPESTLSTTKEQLSGGCVIIASTDMQFQSVLILDDAAAIARQGFDDKDRNDVIIKTRTVLSMVDAQILTYKPEPSSVSTAPSPDTENPPSEDNSKYGRKQYGIKWAPLECFLDLGSKEEGLDRIVDGASLTFHRDKLNPLHVHREHSKTVLKSDEADSHFLLIPKFVVSATSMQYLLIHSVLTNLLIYKDPGKGKRAEKLQNMLLALEQQVDLSKIQMTVLALQERIRLADCYISRAPNRLSSAKHNELRESWIHGREELSVMMEAIKNFRQIEMHKKTEGVGYKLYIQMDEFVWLMMQDLESPLFKWTFNNATITWILNEDQSSVNTIEIDSFNVENMQPPSPMTFKDIISAYLPQRQKVDFRRNKMFRVYRHELAPVAGIQVIDHLEINMFPLFIQLSYETGKQMMRYVFPQKKTDATAVSSQHQPSGQAHEGGVGTLTPSGSMVSIASLAGRDSAISNAGSVISSDLWTIRDSSAVKESKRRGTADSRHQPHLSSSSHLSTSTALNATLQPPIQVEKKKAVTELKQMQARATENRSFIYIKVPSVLHCLTYRGLREKNLEDLNMFEFNLPTLEYRNKTWTWFDFVNAVKKDAMIAALTNTGALVREKLFQKRKLQSAVGNSGAADGTKVASIDNSNGPPTASDTQHQHKSILPLRVLLNDGHNAHLHRVDSADDLYLNQMGDAMGGEAMLSKGKMILGRHFLLS